MTALCFDDFLAPDTGRASQPQYVSKTNPYSRDDEPYLALETDEFFLADDRREFGLPTKVLIDEIAIVNGNLEGFGHTLTQAGTPRVARTLKVPLRAADVPAAILERLTS